MTFGARTDSENNIIQLKIELKIALFSKLKHF